MNGPDSASTTPHNRLSVGRTDTTTTTATISTAPTTASPALTGGKSTSASASASASLTSSAASCNGPITKQSSTGSPRIVFGQGAVTRLPSELNHLRLTSPLIVSSPSRISLARRVQALIPNLRSRILDSALVNVPQRVVDDAVGRVSGCDCVISVGGSSAVKLAKAVGMRKKIPHICIPTTYSGSEMPLMGDARRGGSKSRRHRSDSSAEKSGSGSSSTNSDADNHAMPTIIIYDEDLTSTSRSMTISAPNEAQSSVESRRRSTTDDDAQWSYIHLPGV